MNNEASNKPNRIEINLAGNIDILPWQEETIREYIPVGSHIHGLARLKDGEIDCGLEVAYCIGTGVEFTFVGWLN